MNVKAPLFREGHEWRKLTPAERAGKKWKYVLLADVFIAVNTGVCARYLCKSGGSVWMEITPHGLRIKKGYAWNGNTASPDFLFGSPLLLPSLPHDALFQFSGAPGFPEEIGLNWTNCLYFALAPRWAGWAYYSGLAVGSWVLWARAPKDGDTVLPQSLHAEEPT